MKQFATAICTLAVLIFHSSGAAAQGDRDVRIESRESERIAVPAGKLMRVDEGVFTVKFGQTIDLTNRRLLLTIKDGPVWGEDGPKCCQIAVSGQIITGQWAEDPNTLIGKRIDLKRLKSTSSYVQDKERCFVDVVDVVDRKGAPGTATFRLFCP
jgi:hypothetical protein